MMRIVGQPAGRFGGPVDSLEVMKVNRTRGVNCIVNAKLPSSAGLLSETRQGISVEAHFPE